MPTAISMQPEVKSMVNTLTRKGPVAHLTRRVTGLLWSGRPELWAVSVRRSLPDMHTVLMRARSLRSMVTFSACMALGTDGSVCG